MAFSPPYGIDYEIKSADRGLIKGVKANHLKMCSFQLWRHRFLGLSSPSLSKIRVPRLNTQKETHAVSLSGTIRRPDLNLVSTSYKKLRRLQSGGKKWKYKMLSKQLRRCSDTKLHLLQLWCWTWTVHISHLPAWWFSQSATVCCLQNIKPSINVSDPIK